MMNLESGEKHASKFNPSELGYSVNFRIISPLIASSKRRRLSLVETIINLLLFENFTEVSSAFVSR